MPIPRKIIAKYAGTNSEKLLPVGSNQKMNAYLKELADICGIRKTMTSHVARHTFSTTVCLDNGISMETLTALLGHRNIRNTQIYAKVTKRKVYEEMVMLKKKL